MRVGSWIVDVIQCFGVDHGGADPGVVDLGGVDHPEVWTSLLSAYLDCCYRATTCITFYNPI
jgi:hypothetical protein